MPLPFSAIGQEIARQEWQIDQAASRTGAPRYYAAWKDFTGARIKASTLKAQVTRAEVALRLPAGF